ncbi:MAG TPA: SWIM zinc finger family protein, partial [Nannocystis exedens]|nr:SWIM zinc finger family protein [Nannocystis exedens]
MPRPIVLLTSQQVQALAPDEASFGRAKKLGHARFWTGLGRSSRAIWGEFRGSRVYQVRLETTAFASHCSCPVRKLPCKHTLALLLIAAEEPAALALRTEPDWVSDWLDRRQAAQRAKAAKAKEGAKKPVDPGVQAKRAERAEKRRKRVGEGMEQLDRWLCDLVRVGLASVEHRSPGIFEEQARRLVDAQAPGLAAWVRGLAALPLATADWPERLLRQLGRLALFVRAYRRIDTLDRALQADLRRLCGWSVSRDSVIAQGERRRDRFQVIAQELSEEDRVRAERTWLIGQKYGASALILRYLIGGRKSEEPALTLGVE